MSGLKKTILRLCVVVAVVFELNPYLFLDKADIHTSDKTEGNGDE